MIVAPTAQRCPHCGSDDVDKGFTGLELCNGCGGLFRTRRPMTVVADGKVRITCSVCDDFVEGQITGSTSVLTRLRQWWDTHQCVLQPQGVLF